MQYVTDTELGRFPTLEALDPAQRDQALADASRVHRYIARNEWIAEEDLRAYGERNDLPPDRLNTALSLLADTGKIATFGAPPPPVIAEVPKIPEPAVEEQAPEPDVDPVEPNAPAEAG